MYTLPNCIIGKYLSDITKLECLGVIRNGDISAENIMKSYGIKTIFKINQGNFFLRLYFFCKAIKIIGFNKSIKKLIKLRFNKIQIGRDIYEHYTTFSRDPGPKKINRLFDPKEWDIGMISKEEMIRCANSPLKIHYQSPGMKYNFYTDSIWRKFKSALIVVRFTPDPAIYDFYYEVSDILKEVEGWRHIYFDYKKAAIYAGLGVRAKNSLVHNRKFAFNCKILALGFEEEITGYK